jgi:hypothetical protein
MYYERETKKFNVLLVHSLSKLTASFKPGAHVKGARGGRLSPSTAADVDYSHRPRGRT